MLSQIGPFLAMILLVLGAAFAGIYPVRKLIEVGEAKHELRQGSPGYLRSMMGWGVIVIWLAATWYCATILGDWSVSGDLDGAIARSTRRLEVLLHVLAALGDG